MLKRLVKTALSWPAQCFRTCPGMLYCSGTLRGLVLLRAHLPSCSLSMWCGFHKSNVAVAVVGALVKTCEELVKVVREGWVAWVGQTGIIALVVREGFNALPHMSEVRILKLLLYLFFIGALSFPDAPLQIGLGCWPVWEALSLSLSRLWTSLFIQGLWLIQGKCGWSCG